MNRFKTSIARTKSLISIKTYKRPHIFIILMMILFNVFILLIAAGIALTIDDSFTSYIDALMNGSIKWMLTPNAILVIENPNTLVLAVIVLMIGMVLFSGVIIALTTNGIKDYIAHKKSSSGKIHVENHIVILNWNSKVPELISDLLFVESLGVTVVLLADVDKAYAESYILNAISRVDSKHNLAKMNVLVKQGDPLLRSNLDNISISKARAVIIMNPNRHQLVDDQMTQSDFTVITQVLALGSINFDQYPPIVVEIKKEETKEKLLTLNQIISTLKKHEIMPIVFDQRLGQIIAQTLIESRIKDVYLSLFSFKGSEVYMVKKTTIDEIIEHHGFAIPVGRNNDDVYVLSPNNLAKKHKSEHLYPNIDLKMKKQDTHTGFDTFIIGKNNKIEFILAALKQYGEIYDQTFQSGFVEKDDIPTFVEKLNKEKRPTKILLLSDEEASDDSLDANVINTLIYLEGKISNPNVEIIVELLNPKNEPIISGFHINNTIISNKIISLLLTKIALFKETAPFYEELLTIDQDEAAIDRQSIHIIPAKSMLNMSFPIEFKSKKQWVKAIFESTNYQKVPIGLYRNDKLHILEGDLHKEPYSIELDDQIIIMTL